MGGEYSFERKPFAKPLAAFFTGDTEIRRNRAEIWPNRTKKNMKNCTVDMCNALCMHSSILKFLLDGEKLHYTPFSYDWMKMCKILYNVLLFRQLIHERKQHHGHVQGLWVLFVNFGITFIETVHQNGGDVKNFLMWKTFQFLARKTVSVADVHEYTVI